MQRATEYPTYVPGPPPRPAAQALANARWLVAFRAALARERTPLEAYDEANAAVPEALTPIGPESEGGLPPVSRRNARERLRDERVHELWMPFGLVGIVKWPGRSAPGAERRRTPSSAGAPAQPAAPRTAPAHRGL